MPKTTRTKRTKSSKDATSYSKEEKKAQIAKARDEYSYLPEYLSEYILAHDGTLSVKAAPCCGGQRGFTFEMSDCSSMCDARDGGCECMHHGNKFTKVSIDDPRLKPLNWSEESESESEDRDE